jgi:hypothetical protein
LLLFSVYALYAQGNQKAYYMTLSKISMSGFSGHYWNVFDNQRTAVALDNTVVNIVTHSRKPIQTDVSLQKLSITPVRFLVLHDDENTGVAAARIFLQLP